MALTFDATYYLQQRPDVFQAFVAAAGSTGLTWAQFAEQHYNNSGRFEGSNPNAIFNTNEYLTANPDVAAAGVNPFQHYLAVGASEGRAPSASFPSFASFDADAYLAANPDLVAAGITTKNQAYEHFVLAGQFEGRPGAPAIDHGLPGQTFTLTTGVDNLAGTAANDMFIAANNGGAVADGTTLNTGDTVNGGAGIDTLQIIQSAATAVRVPNLSNVENIDGQAFGSAILLNLATSTGVEKISLSNGNNGLTATNVANIVDLELNNTTTGASVLSATYNAATIGGTEDVQNVSVNSAVGAVTVNGIETMNVTSTGAATATGAFPDLNQLAINAAGLKTLNVSGSGLIEITNALLASVKTLDASASTGGVYAEFGAAADVTVTGGSGDDAFAFNGTLTDADVVDGGEGFDTVGVTGGDFSLATNATLKGINALTNVERVSFNGADAGTTINGATFANAGLTHVLFNTWDTVAAGDGNDVINNADAALTYQFGTANDGSASFALKAGATSLNIELDGINGKDTVANDGSDADIGGLSIVTAGANSTTTPVSISLASNGDLADAFLTAGVFQSQNYNETGAVTVAAGSTVDVTGDGNLAIFGGTAAALTAGFSGDVTLDASELTGNTIIAGSDFTATAGVVGTSKTDLTTGNSGVDTITLGSGNDVVVFHSGAASGTIEVSSVGPAFAATGNVFHDSITGFDTDADMLFFGAVLSNAVASDDYTAIAAATQTTIDGFSGAGATLLAAANAAAGDAAPAGAWTAFSFQGETYALYDTGTANVFDNADILVQLVGVSVADLSDANFAV